MPPNVLLLVLDSVRARNTGLHGHVHETTPHLEAFAADCATVYEQARAPGARSITSHVSLFTGLDVAEHSITSADAKLRSATSVFERLRDEHGYATGVFSENVWITDVDIGLRDGFETIEGPQNVPFPEALDPRTFVAHEGKGQYRTFLRESVRNPDTIKSLTNGLFIKLASDYPRLVPRSGGTSPGTVYADLFERWVADQPGPWAACINLMDAHLPYEPDPDHNRWGDRGLFDIQDDAPGKWELACTGSSWWQRGAIEYLYDGAIHQADAVVREIIETLEERDTLDDTLVVITSDHGEGFGEPSLIRPGVRVAAHNVALHEVLTHVPLVVKFPGQSDPARVEEVASLTRFPDAVRASIDGDWSPDEFVPDRPVVAMTYGLTEDEQLRQRALRYCDEDDLWGFDSPVRAVYKDADDATVTKHVTWREHAATVTVRDAQTSYRVSDDGAAIVDEVFGALSDAGVRIEGGGIEDVDTETYSRLEDLGYV